MGKKSYQSDGISFLHFLTVTSSVYFLHWVETQFNAFSIITHHLSLILTTETNYPQY